MPGWLSRATLLMLVAGVSATAQSPASSSSPAASPSKDSAESAGPRKSNKVWTNENLFEAHGAVSVIGDPKQCCPKNKGGRTVTRVETDPVVLQFREKMQTEEAQAIDRQRSKVAEFPNLWIKEKMGLRRFRVYGLLKANFASRQSANSQRRRMSRKLSGNHENNF